MHNLNISQIDFSDVLPFWRHKLWPNRNSPIETHSAQTWPFNNTQEQIDMSIFDREVLFLGVFTNNNLVGVASGHASSDEHYRMRGFWIDPNYRGFGGHSLMLEHLENHAMAQGCLMTWTVPRQEILTLYLHQGYLTIGDYFPTETHHLNIHVFKYL